MKSRTCRNISLKVESFDPKPTHLKPGPLAQEIEEIFELLRFRVCESPDGNTWLCDLDGDVIREATAEEGSLFYALQTMAYTKGEYQ